MHAVAAHQGDVLAREDAPPSGHDRTTIAFGVADQKGALRRVLSVLEDADVNLTRIESRPSRSRPWHYVFLVDLEGHRKDPAVARALTAVEKSADFVKVIGSYPSTDLPGTASTTPGASAATAKNGKEIGRRASGGRERTSRASRGGGALGDARSSSRRTTTR